MVLLLALLACAWGAGFNKTAYYIVWAPQVEAASFPQSHVAGKDVYILQPANFTPQLIKRLRTVANPGARLLLYMDFINVPLLIPGSCSTGHVMGDKRSPARVCDTPQQPFYQCGASDWQQGLQQAYADAQVGPARLMCNNGTSATILCQYPGLAAYFWTQSLAVTVSKMLAEVVLSLGVDGVYLDGYANAYVRGQITQDLFAEFLKNNNSECFIDVNGDGQADTVDTAVAQVDAWGRYLVLLLRQALGPSRTVLANAGGENSDPQLNGLTVEMEYCVDGAVCDDAFGSSHAMSAAAGAVRSPLVSVAWLKDGVDFPVAKQCAFAMQLQQNRPYVAVGVDIFDGEVVICPGL